ncbi:6719_t:CDS:1, partial [Gigaspora rosea]
KYAEAYIIEAKEILTGLKGYSALILERNRKAIGIAFPKTVTIIRQILKMLE